MSTDFVSNGNTYVDLCFSSYWEIARRSSDADCLESTFNTVVINPANWNYVKKTNEVTYHNGV